MFMRLLFALAGLTFAGAGIAADAPWVEGKNYFSIDPAQPTSTGDKIEVLEVFSFGCPACYQFNPFFKKIQAALPKNAQIAYLPASFNPTESWPTFQRGFYAAQALGIEDKSHDAAYNAVWGEKGPLSIHDAQTNKIVALSIEDLGKFYSAYGVKAEDFVATANSFAVGTKMKRADAYVKATGVDSTPTIIVNGKYRVTGQSAGDLDKLTAIVVYLVQKESAGH